MRVLYVVRRVDPTVAPMPCSQVPCPRPRSQTNSLGAFRSLSNEKSLNCNLKSAEMLLKFHGNSTEIPLKFSGNSTENSVDLPSEIPRNLHPLSDVYHLKLPMIFSRFTT